MTCSPVRLNARQTTALVQAELVAFGVGHHDEAVLHRGVAAFLAGEDSRYVTGNTLFADGGGHINGVTWAPDLPD